MLLRRSQQDSHNSHRRWRSMKITRLAMALSFFLLPSILRGDDPKPDPILPGRPDAHVGNDAGLGATFQSLAAGISLRVPAGLKEVRRGVGGDDIIQYVDEAGGKSQFRVSRLVLAKPAPLVTDRDSKGNVMLGKDKLARQGMLDLMADQLKADMGGAEILRQDTVKLAIGDAGIIAARYQLPDATARLTQRAIIQGSDQLYYILELVTPAPAAGDVSEDPQVRQAVDLFGRVLDSVQLLDQSRLEDEKNQR